MGSQVELGQGLAGHGGLSRLFLEVAILITWSHSWLLEEEESGFPHKETHPARFSGFHPWSQKHPVTEMLLKFLPEDRGLETLKSLARLSIGPGSV